MLRSDSAELNGSQLVWLEEPPEQLVRQRVLVVAEDSKSVADERTNMRYQRADVAGRLQWQGDTRQVQRVQRDAR